MAKQDMAKQEMTKPGTVSLRLVKELERDQMMQAPFPVFCWWPPPPMRGTRSNAAHDLKDFQIFERKKLIFFIFFALHF
jgi:hypothetical protein